MQNTPHTIRSLIEETSRAYDIYTSHQQANTDYAEFAAQCYTDFLHALGRPDLTQQEIRRMLRSGSYEHKSTAPNSCWSTFLAKYIRTQANSNNSDV